MIHDVLLVAVQAHPLEVVTVDDPLAPANGASCMLVGAMVNVHDEAFCVTVNVLPAMVAVPTRTWEVVFVFALNETVPLPEPLAPLVTVSQPLLLLTAVQAQPTPEVTVVEAVPPAATTDQLFDEIANVQPAAACVTVNVWPPTVNVPLRGDVLGLADALKPTLPSPLPLAPLVTVSQPVLLLTAVQAHPVGAATAVEPVALPAAIDWLGGVRT